MSSHLVLILSSCVAQPTDWTIKINKKERRLAVATALQSAAPDIKVIEDVQVRLAICTKGLTFACLIDHDNRLVCGLTFIFCDRDL